MRRSAASEDGRALGHEGGYAFLIIGAEAELAHGVALEIEFFVECFERCRPDECLGPSKSAGGALRETVGKRGDLCTKRIFINAFPDQTPRFGLFGRQRLPGESEPKSTRLSC